jgi:sodium/pantothenate symporter
MLVMHISGVFAPAVIDTAALDSTDYVVPKIMLQYMHPVVAGLFIAAPLAAIMSTVSSLLILASAAIVKDIYLNYIVKDEKKSLPQFSKKISNISMFTTLIIGLIVMVFVIKPPSAIVWINLFAMGGLECAFFCPILFGLYWKKANALGSVMSSILGVAAFLFISSWNTGHPEAVISLFGTSPIVPSILISIAAFVIFSLIGKKPDQETLDLFYPEQA